MGNSAKNFLSFAAGSVISAGVAMLATPLLLRWLGSADYGIFRLIVDSVGYLALFEFGLADAILPLVARAKAQDRESLPAVLAAGVRAYLRILPGKILAGIAIVFILFKYILPDGHSVLAQLSLSVGVAVVSSCFCVLNPFRLLVEANQRSYLLQALVSVQTILTAIFSLAAARFSLGVGGQFLAILLGSGPYNIYLLSVARKNPRASDGDHASLGRQIWRANHPLFLSSICSRLSLLSDSLIVAHFFGPAAVTTFYVTQRLISLCQTYLYGVGNATWARLAELHWQGRQAEFETSLLRLTRMILTLAIALVVPVCAFNSSFLALWVGPARNAGELVTWSAGFNCVALALISLWSWTFSAGGLAPRLVPQYVLFTVVNVSASLLLVKPFGVAGPLMGTSISIFLVSGWVLPYQLQRQFAVKASRLAMPIARAAVVGGTYAWILRKIAAAGNWPILLLALVASGAVGLGLAWLSVLDAEDRVFYRERLRAFISRKKVASGSG